MENGTDPGKSLGYNLYTYFRLKQSVWIFCSLSLVHFLAVYMMKGLRAEKFREADKLEKFFHVMEKMSIPFPVEDFDVPNEWKRERTLGKI